MSKLLFGTDPECVAVYEREGTLYTLPPYFFRKELGVPASDDIRHPVFLETENWKFHEDGAAFEMAIHPSHNPRDLWDTIQDCARVANEKIISQFPEHCLPLLRFMPTVGFDVERWKNMGPDFFMSTRFGCDPDSDAFDITREPMEIDASQWPERYTGGHIHISGSPLFESDPILSTQCQALTSGCAAIAYSDTPDLDKKRTILYGRPGKHRVQNYGKFNPFGPEYSVGIEYRTPSSRWASDWNIAKEVFKWVEIGVNNLLETSLGLELVRELSQPAIEAIITANQSMARDVLSVVESRI